MYLDKPLKEHRLLQAIARTNRPYMGMKEAGLIIDYLGILNNFHKAFELYSGEDELFSKEEVAGILSDMDSIKKDFSDLLQKVLDLFSEIPKEYSRENLVDAIRIITSSEKQRKIFLDSFKSLRKKFELLGPEEMKAELLSSYKWILAIYTYYEIKEQGYKTDEQRKLEKLEELYLSKTVKFAHKTTEIEQIKREMPQIEFDENYLQSLERNVESKKEKVADIVFALNKFVLVDKDSNPVSEVLIEKVQRLMDKWKKKNVDFEKMYDEGASIIIEMNKLYRRQKLLKLSDSEYSILLSLEERWNDPRLINDAKYLVNQLKNHDLLFPGSFEQKTASKAIEKEIRRFLRKNYVPLFKIQLSKIDELTCEILEKLRYNAQK
jgi:type I restriction enzyme R subunit